MDKLVIQQLINNLESEFNQLDNFLLKCSKSEKTNLLNQIAYHIVSSGGKRIRPLLSIATCKLFDPSEKVLNACNLFSFFRTRQHYGRNSLILSINCEASLPTKSIKL